MVEFATYQFRLNARQKDGCTLREHLNVAYKANGIMPEELADEPDIPESAVHVWHYFIQLNRARGSNGFGANPLSYSEIKNWCDLTAIRLEQWELNAIVEIDAAYITESAKEAK